MHFAVDVGDERGIKAHGITEFVDEGNQRDEVFARRAEGNVFRFHGGEGYFSLEAGTPKNGTTKRKDDVSSAAASTVGISCIFMSIKPSKISIGIAVYARIRGWGHDEALVHRAFQVATDPNECQLMPSAGFEGVTTTLVDSKGNVWSGVATKVEEHANHSGVIEGSGCGVSIGILGKRGGFGRGVDGSGEAATESDSFNDALGETGLQKSDLGAGGAGGTDDVNAKEAFSSSFSPNTDAGSL